MDHYDSYADLETSQHHGVDYRISWRRGASNVAVLSIHGGEIEPGTTRLASIIAGAEHTFYSFEGIKAAANFALHITSTRFDEPLAMEIAAAADFIVSVHGYAGKEAQVQLGGRDFELRDAVTDKLQEAGFATSICPQARYCGVAQENICNLCRRGKGVQIEVSRGLRARMFRDLTPAGRRFPTPTLFRFARAVRAAIATLTAAAGG